MNTIRNIIESTVSISMFNRGLAGKIFDEVKTKGVKIVMKNNVPECVLISPDEYIELLDELNDTKLLLEANRRMENFNPETLISQEEVDKELGIEASDYEGFDEIEIE